MRRLRKADVERMMASFDADPVAALSGALAHILGFDDADWASLLARCEFPGERTTALLRGDQAALDALLRDLNELRTIPVR
jgi:hypothetical protein